jgi:hypothetical protein
VKLVSSGKDVNARVVNIVKEETQSVIKLMDNVKMVVNQVGLNHVVSNVNSIDNKN